MDYGSKLKEIRKSKNISARSLASQVGLDPSQVSKIENNVSKPSLDALEKICSVLDITLAEFFAEEAICLPPELSKLAERYNNLTEDEKNALRAILKLIIKE